MLGYELTFPPDSVHSDRTGNGSVYEGRLRHVEDSRMIILVAVCAPSTGRRSSPSDGHPFIPGSRAAGRPDLSHRLRFSSARRGLGTPSATSSETSSGERWGLVARRVRGEFLLATFPTRCGPGSFLRPSLPDWQGGSWPPAELLLISRSPAPLRVVISSVVDAMGAVPMPFFQNHHLNTRWEGGSGDPLAAVFRVTRSSSPFLGGRDGGRRHWETFRRFLGPG